MNKFKDNKLLYSILVVAIMFFAVRITCDYMGYRLLDIVKNPRDKEASDAPYGASHK